MGWDCAEVVVLRRDHLVSLLARYQTGEITAGQVERWANAIEGRDAIGLEPGFEDVVSSALHTLANPVLEGELDHRRAEALIETLSLGSS